MDGTINYSPADAVTTRFLQNARRSAERKTKQRRKKSAPENTGNISIQQQFCQSTPHRGMFTPLQDRVHSLCRLASDNGWNLTELNRIWSFGYDPDHITSIIFNLPSCIHDCIQHASECWLRIAKTKMNQPLDNMSIKANAGNLSWSASTCCAALREQVTHQSGDIGSDHSTAVLSMTFDASTQMRTGFWLSPSMSRLLNMPMEELSARLAHHDLALPFSDMDCIRIFLHLLLHELAQPGVPHVKYVRLCSRSRGDPVYQLVCWCTLSLADGKGKVVEVKCIKYNHTAYLRLIYFENCILQIKSS
jgi:hypothetical protein